MIMFLLQILHIHAVMKRRNMNVIGPMVHNLSKDAEPLTMTQLTNLYYASSFLSVCTRISNADQHCMNFTSFWV